MNDFKPKGAFQAWAKIEIGFLRKCIKDIKDNHINKLYGKIDTINEKLFNRLPVWVTIVFGVLCAIISMLTTLLAIQSRK